MASIFQVPVTLFIEKRDDAFKTPGPMLYLS